MWENTSSKYLDVQLAEVNDYFNGVYNKQKLNGKLLTRIAIPASARYDDTITVNLNRKIRLTNDQINNFNLFTSIDGVGEFKGFVSVEFLVCVQPFNHV